jgi:translation elongation factor EF-Tu-like GTPase
MFEFKVQDVFSITGRGTVFAGTVTSGTVQPGDRVIYRTPTHEITTRVVGIESNKKMLKSAGEGDVVGILCPHIKSADLQQGGNSTLVSAPPAPWWKFW